MNKLISGFGIMGGRPSFDQPIPVGQLYFPEWGRYEAAFRGIFERQYYTNNGPLLTQLEDRLQAFLGVKHAICVTNGTFGLMMAADALSLSGKVILPSFTFVASAQSLIWAGLKPVFCDVNPETHQIDLSKIDRLLDDDVSAIMGVNLWGGACNIKELENYAQQNNLSLFFDSAHGFGCETTEAKLANFGSLEVFSFHATKTLSATEGGCICTNDDKLADRLREIRPSYGNTKKVDVLRVANARMSEAQAAIALLNLEDFSENRRRNKVMFELYERNLESVPGVRLVKPAGVTISNYEYVVCEIEEVNFGLSRDQLISVLKAENVLARRYFYPGAHRALGYEDSDLPVTDRLSSICMQLPIGEKVDEFKVDKICDLIRQVQNVSGHLRSHLGGELS